MDKDKQDDNILLLEKKKGYSHRPYNLFGLKNEN